MQIQLQIQTGTVTVSAAGAYRFFGRMGEKLLFKFGKFSYLEQESTTV